MSEKTVNSTLNLESEVYIERGGPTYRLMQKIGVIKGEGPSLGRRIFWFLVITWFPIFILSIFEGRALGPTPRESFLLDFATYARFFLAIPILIIAEVTVGPRLTAAAVQFVRGGFVGAEEYPVFEKAVARVRKLRESGWAELIILAIAIYGAWGFTVERFYGQTLTWQTIRTAGGTRESLAGFWYHIIAIPLFQFLFLRWIWRLLIWSNFLGMMSRLKLKLVPTHPDEAGGLAFLGTAHLSLAIFALGMGSVLSADTAFRLIFEGEKIMSFKILFLSYIAISELVFLGPLLVFVPLLARTRRQGLRDYSTLANVYNRSFHEKWVEGKGPEREQLLGSADIQSLADLGNSFKMVRDMNVFPFSGKVVLQFAVVAALPALPLVFLVIPIEEIMKLLAGALL